MSAIRARLSAGCEIDIGSARLRSFLDGLSAGEPGTAALSLAVPLADIGLPSGLVVSRDVEAHFVPLKEPQGGAAFSAVDWTPTGGGPFPKFVGFIGLEPTTDPRRCELVLNGAYDPPLTVIGELFDAVLGRKIADVTAHRLLLTLKEVVEARPQSSAPRPA